MMEKLRKRGAAIGERRVASVRSEIKAALAEELPEDVRIIESTAGIELEARRLKQRLVENSSLRDVGFLMRSIR